MAIFFQPAQPVASRLITVRVLRGGRDGLLAGFNQIVVVEVRSSSPETQFVEVVILLAHLLGQMTRRRSCSTSTGVSSTTA